MFEDSTFASTGRIRMRTRAGFAAALIFDSAIVVALVLVPLLYPRVLPHAFTRWLMDMPTVPVDQPQPETQTAVHVAPAVLNLDPFAPPRKIPPKIYYADSPEPKTQFNTADLADPRALDGSNNPFGPSDPVRVARAADQRPFRVSSSVIEGLIVQKTVPVYPPIARATHTQGTVVLQATISREGTIDNLRVVSGSPMLQRAALDAVSTWRYRPYMLNGEPIAVETTINVVFRLE